MKQRWYFANVLIRVCGMWGAISALDFNPCAEMCFPIIFSTVTTIRQSLLAMSRRFSRLLTKDSHHEQKASKDQVFKQT